MKLLIGVDIDSPDGVRIDSAGLAEKMRLAAEVFIQTELSWIARETGEPFDLSDVTATVDVI